MCIQGASVATDSEGLSLSAAAAAAATARNKSRNHNRDLWMLFLLLLLLLGWCRRCFKHFYDVSAAFMSAMRRLQGEGRSAYETCVG